jgi:ribosomal protein S12 methylthiotransferase
MRVLVDSVDGAAAIARSEADAPEIDGVVRIGNARGLKVGEWVDVKISSADAYDLKGRVVQ